MSETQKGPNTQPTAERPPVSPEQAKAAQSVYMRLVQFASTNGEPARLDYFGIYNRITQARRDDIGQYSVFKEFSDDGQYIGERDARYTDVNGKDQNVRLIVMNENGSSKLGVLAELDLSGVIDHSHEVDHQYRIYPDMNIRYIREDFIYEETDDPDNPMLTTNKSEPRYLSLEEIEELSLMVDSLHTIK